MSRGETDLHLHAGGQGVWQARMIASLGVPATGGGDSARRMAERVQLKQIG